MKVLALKMAGYNQIEWKLEYNKILKLHLPRFLLCMSGASQHTEFAGCFSCPCQCSDMLER